MAPPDEPLVQIKKKHGMLVCVVALRPSQQFANNVRMIYCIPGLNQY